MAKWTEPHEKPPSWLNPSKEIVSSPEDERLSKIEFQVYSVDELLSLPCNMTAKGAIGIAANACNESDRGQKYRVKSNNVGGWKITKNYADWHKKQYGRETQWWCAPGNKAPGATLVPYDLKGGDPPWCYYRVFSSLSEFYSQWQKRFVPKPGVDMPVLAPPNEDLRYRKTGEQFWSGQSWFDDLCIAGYKGRNTAKNWQGSNEAHEQIMADLAEIWAQSRLKTWIATPGFTVDGDWGRKSKTACKKFQSEHGLPATGEVQVRGVLDILTLENLASLPRLAIHLPE